MTPGRDVPRPHSASPSTTLVQIGSDSAWMTLAGPPPLRSRFSLKTSSAVGRSYVLTYGEEPPQPKQPYTPHSGTLPSSLRSLAIPRRGQHSIPERRAAWGVPSPHSRPRGAVPPGARRGSWSGVGRASSPPARATRRRDATTRAAPSTQRRRRLDPIPSPPTSEATTIIRGCGLPAARYGDEPRETRGPCTVVLARRS